MGILERRKKSIRNRLMIDIGLILVGVSLVNYILANMIYSDMFYKNEMDKAEIQASAAMDVAQAIVKGASDLMNNIVGISCLSDSEKTLKDKIQRLYGYVSPFEDIAIIEADNNGRSVKGNVFNVAGDKVFQRAFNREFNSVEILEYKSIPYLVFIKPIKAGKEQVESIAIGVIPVREFFEEILRTSNGPICIVADKSGRGFVGQQNEQGDLEIKKLQGKSKIKRFFADQSLYNKGHNVKLKDNYMQGEFNFNYELIKGSEWFLGIVNGTASETKNLAMFQYAIINGMLIAIAIGIILVYFIANSIAKRMQDIARHLGDSIQSEFRASVPLELLNNEDEIGTIAKEMKYLEEEVVGMLSNIKESIDYLNDTVVTMQQKEHQEKTKSEED